jgi:hypothetical protein
MKGSERQTEPYKIMQTAFGDGIKSQVFEWFYLFKNNKSLLEVTSITDAFKQE